MSALVNDIIAGLLVALISGVSGYLVKQRFFQDIKILPSKSHNVGKIDYSYLSGVWHVYCITRNPIDPNPIWIHGIREYKIKKNKIQVTARFIDHPSGELTYNGYGEIRHGRMINMDYSVLDETEFIYSVFTNLVKSELVGIWMGFDGFDHQIAAPAILSRAQKSPNELNEILRSSTTTIIPISQRHRKIFSDGKIITDSS